MFTLLGYVHNIVDSVDEISGSSAGAVIGAFIAYGKSTDEILDFMFNVNPADMFKPSVRLLLKEYGFCGYDSIKQKFREFFDGKNIKFKHLKKKLYISAYCLTTSKMEYFSVDTHPNMSVIDAICMSVAIPFIFKPFVYRDNMYIDGGLIETAPCNPFMDKEDVVCVEVMNSEIPIINSFFGYCVSIVYTLFTNRIKYTCIKNVVRIHVKEINLMNLFMTYEDKMKLYLIGRTHSGFT
jgi:predicted acylesterase/phospholipase RssA